MANHHCRFCQAFHALQTRKLEHDCPPTPNRREEGTPAYIVPGPYSNFLVSAVLIYIYIYICIYIYIHVCIRFAAPGLRHPAVHGRRGREVRPQADALQGQTPSHFGDGQKSLYIYIYDIFIYVCIYISYYVMSYHIISYHIISYHIISYHIVYLLHTRGLCRGHI